MIDFKNFSPNAITINPKALKSKMSLTKDTIVAEDTLYVIYPERYHKLEIAEITNKVKLLGVFLLLDDNYNGKVIMKTQYMELEPSSIETIMINDVPYNILTFNKGNNLLASRKLIKDSDFIFKLLDDWNIKNGNIPFYFEYGFISKNFIQAAIDGVSNLANNPVGIWAQEATIARAENGKYLRQTLSDKGKIPKPKWVGFNNVPEAYNNTFSLITGSYMDKGLTRALTLDDPVKTEIEDAYKS